MTHKRRLDQKGVSRWVYVEQNEQFAKSVLEYRGIQQPTGRGSILYIYEHSKESRPAIILPRLRKCIFGGDHFGDLRSEFPADSDVIRIIQNIVEANSLIGGEVINTLDPIYDTCKKAWKLTIFMPSKTG